MVKNYKQITYRYLKGQKNRTLLTILGIILSVALITSIGSIIVSARDALIKDAIRENGSQHGIFANLTLEEKDKIINHTLVVDHGVSKTGESLALGNTTEAEREAYGDFYHRYINLYNHDDNALKMIPKVNLSEGRMPENQNEIIIENWLSRYFDKEVKLGDKIKLPIGKIEYGKTNDFISDEEKEFTVVGFIKPNYIWNGRLVTSAILGKTDNTVEGEYEVYVKTPDVRNANEDLNKIAEDLNIDKSKLFYNNKVLRLYAESLDATFNSSLTTILAFVVGLIIVSTVAVIYNSFNISVIERISQFGLLRSVGATPKQIKRLVLKEAGILSLISIPLGLALGIVAMIVVLYIISLITTDIILFNDMKIGFSLPVMIISSLVGVFTVFLSAIGPAKLASKVSPLEAIKNTGALKKEKYKKTRTNKLVRFFLGMEGEIAYKNLRRNRKRFIITVFSMVISIVLFITFASFSNFMFQMGVIVGGDSGQFYVSHLGEQTEKIYNDLMNIDEIEKVILLNQLNGKGKVEEKHIDTQMIERAPSNFAKDEEGKITVSNIAVYSLEDERFNELKSVLKDGTIDVEKINKENGVLVINNAFSNSEFEEKTIVIEGYKFKIGDMIEFTGNGDEASTNLTISGILEEGILDRLYSSNASIMVFTTEEVINNLSSNYNITLADSTEMHVYTKDNKNVQMVRDYFINLENEVQGFNYVDLIENTARTEEISIVISIFLYGFVAIIALISSINIINTISTNIILRTKEIAMIKAVGMSQSGIKRMVSLESLYYGLYASVIGSFIGSLLTYLLYNIAINIKQFVWEVPWNDVAIASVGCIIIALISGIYPLKRINEKIIIESIKAEN